MHASPIRISRILTHPVEHIIRPDRVVISHAGKHDRSRFLLVTVENSDGVRGYGEAATVLLWSGETSQFAQYLINEIFWPKMRDATFHHPSEALRIMDQCVVNHSFAKSAVDTAIWDLWARQQERSVFELFADRTPEKTIPTRASIGAYDTRKTVELACAFRADGVKVFKFKTGVKGLDDVDRLRAAREALGQEAMITIDYNGAFDQADEAVAAIESLLPFDLALVEQPTHRDRLALMAEVRRRVQVPILADESIFSPQHLNDAIALDAFDIVSLYPGKNGGFTHSIRMAQAAARAGKACAIGSNLESDLGQTAMATLAAGLQAFPTATMPCDLGSSLYYTRSILKTPLPLVDGLAHVPSGPGFAAEPDIRLE